MSGEMSQVCYRLKESQGETDKGAEMPKFYVEMLVEFAGEIEADSQEEAERLAIYDDTVFYQGVDSIDVKEIEEEDEEDE